jgi:hypothetical protein
MKVKSKNAAVRPVSLLDTVCMADRKMKVKNKMLLFAGLARLCIIRYLSRLSQSPFQSPANHDGGCISMRNMLTESNVAAS